MSDFFTRVAQRTLGVAPLVSPRRLTTWGASEASTVTPPVVLTPPRAAELLTADRAISSTVTSDSNDGAARPAVDRTGTRPLLVRPPRDSNVRPARSDRIAAATGIETTCLSKRASEAFDAHADGKREPPSPASATAAPDQQWSAPQPLLPRLTPPAAQFAPLRELPVPSRSEPGPPTLHITIGRVEVRATAPPAAPIRAPREAASQQSLADYLKRGAAGRR